MSDKMLRIFPELQSSIEKYGNPMFKIYHNQYGAGLSLVLGGLSLLYYIKDEADSNLSYTVWDTLSDIYKIIPALGRPFLTKLYKTTWSSLTKEEHERALADGIEDYQIMFNLFNDNGVIFLDVNIDVSKVIVNFRLYDYEDDSGNINF